MTLDAEISRHIYEEARQSCVDGKSVRLEVRIDYYQTRWPDASKDEILRAHLIAYELLILDVAEVVFGGKESVTLLGLIENTKKGNAAPDEQDPE